MRVSVRINATAVATTSPAVATPDTITAPTTVPAPVATPTTILIDGRAFKVGDNGFYIDVEAGNHEMGSYDFIDIGNGVWYNTELNKKLVGFCVTTCNQQYHVVITEEFDWGEFFELPIMPKGKFDGTEWDGTMQNGVGETCNFRCKFVYTQDESFEYMKRAFGKKEVKVINSVEELLHLFGRFEDFLNNKGGRAKNPFIPSSNNF